MGVERQPKTVIFWGQDDIFFTREGGDAYLKDLPQAEMHRLDSGHFAVEDCLDYIARNIRRFYIDKVPPGRGCGGVSATRTPSGRSPRRPDASRCRPRLRRSPMHMAVEPLKTVQ